MHDTAYHPYLSCQNWSRFPSLFCPSCPHSTSVINSVNSLITFEFYIYINIYINIYDIFLWIELIYEYNLYLLKKMYRKRKTRGKPSYQSLALSHVVIYGKLHASCVNRADHERKGQPTELPDSNSSHQWVSNMHHAHSIKLSEWKEKNAAPPHRRNNHM